MSQARLASDIESGGKYKARVGAEYDRMKRLQSQELTPDPVASVFRAKDRPAAAAAGADDDDDEDDEEDGEDEEDSDE